MDDQVIGPALPPGFSESSSSSSKPRRRASFSSGTSDSDSDSSPSSSQSSSDSDSDSNRNAPHKQSVIGPSHPAKCNDASVTENAHKKIREKGATTIGPAMPPGFPTGESQTAEGDNCVSQHSIGPALPPGFPVHGPAQDTGDIGPALPPGFTQDKASFSDEDGDTGFGPRPPAPGHEKTAAEEFEERARVMKHRLLHGEEEEAPQRETWMTELPTVGLRREMGLQARKLGKGSTVKYEDQSVWTDTPADRLRKQQDAVEGRGEKRSVEEPVQSTRDRELSEQVHHHNKKQRAESLLDLHRKKLQKKTKKEEKEKKKKEKKKKKKEHKSEKSKSSAEDKVERKAFNREEDLNVNRFDNAQRKNLIKKSRELNTKFSSGASQFL